MSPTLGVVHGFFPRAFEVVQPGAPTSAYVGIYADSSDLFAWGYAADGTYVETIATLASPTGDSAVAGAVALLSISPLVVVIGTASAGFLDKFTVWRCAAGTTSVIDRTASESGGNVIRPPMHGTDGSVYWIESRVSLDKFWLFSVNAAGTMTQHTDNGDATMDAPGIDGTANAWGLWVPGDEAAQVPYWGNGETDSGYIRIASAGGKPTREVQASYLPFTSDRSEWLSWEQGHGMAGGKALAFLDGAGPDRRVYSVDETTDTPLVGAAHGIDELVSWVEAPDGDLVLYSDAQEFARINGGTVADPPGGSITWTAVEDGPNTEAPLALFALS